MNMNEQKSWRFNWIDALVCLLVVLLAAGAFYKLVVSDKTSAASAADTITYVVQVPAGKDTTLTAFQAGDALYDSDSGVQIGIITNFESVPAETAIPYPDGTAEWGTIEDRYDVYLTVEASGTITSDREYLVNKNYQIRVGAQKNMNTQYRSFYGRIWSVS